MSTRRTVSYVNGVIVKWQRWLGGVPGVLDAERWEDVGADGVPESEMQNIGNGEDDQVVLFDSTLPPIWPDYEAAQAFVSASPWREQGAFMLENVNHKTYVTTAKRR